MGDRCRRPLLPWLVPRRWYEAALTRAKLAEGNYLSHRTRADRLEVVLRGIASNEAAMKVLDTGYPAAPLRGFFRETTLGAILRSLVGSPHTRQPFPRGGVEVLVEWNAESKKWLGETPPERRATSIDELGEGEYDGERAIVRVIQ